MYISYLIGGAVLWFIIRLFMFKPRPEYERIARQQQQKKEANTLYEKNFDVYPYGPFLSSVYLTDYNIYALQKKRALVWETLEIREPFYNNFNILTDENQNHYGYITNLYTNILPSKDYSKILLWYERGIKIGQERFFEVAYVDLEAVTPLPSYSAGNAPDKEKLWYFAPEAVTEFAIPIKPDAVYNVDLPNVVARHFPEIIIVAQSVPGIYDKPTDSNTALLVINSVKKLVNIYPQDWFNKAQLDFGYQWLIRAQRLPESKKISVMGIRMGCYILDETNRNVQRYPPESPHAGAIPTNSGPVKSQ